MKKVLLILATMGSFVLCNAQIKMNSSGNIALGTYPQSSYRLYVYGTPSLGSYFIEPITINPNYSSNTINISTYNSSHPQIIPSIYQRGYVGTSSYPFYQFWAQYTTISPSDLRQKENIRNISNVLNSVLKLQGVKYDIKKELIYSDSLAGDSKEKLEADRKNKIGFIAQDVYKIFPEVVVYDDSTDVYGIEYARMVPLLVEAIKEQQLLIECLQTEIESGRLKNTAQSFIHETESINECVLFQNVPNPFSEITTIEYYLNKNVQDASIYIYDMNGTQLKVFPITINGYGNVVLFGNELKAGMYMYSLISDGKLVSTRQMILTE